MLRQIALVSLIAASCVGTSPMEDRTSLAAWGDLIRRYDEGVRGLLQSDRERPPLYLDEELPKPWTSDQGIHIPRDHPPTASAAVHELAHWHSPDRRREAPRLVEEGLAVFTEISLGVSGPYTPSLIGDDIREHLSITQEAWLAKQDGERWALCLEGLAVVERLGLNHIHELIAQGRTSPEDFERALLLQVSNDRTSP